MKRFFALAAVLVCLSGCWDEKDKVVCDAECRAERSGETSFPSLDTSAPDSFKKAPAKGQ
ncbi:Spore germination protein xc (plasmid) [Pseudomonas putida]|jgi:hypothetical protein|uniref:Spore germination protein xc n=1 Tax=Pseudomonas putida TaxID=303 RepID=A0A1L7NQ66_PSEPU|nr:hypothetical protein CBL13_05752 [Pseudomonas putida]BAW27594.1 Spore germination protein xc [Pseudomonas putida]